MNCLHCTAETAGAALCSGCERTARTALVNIAAYHADLFSLPAIVSGIRKTDKIPDPTGNAVSAKAADDPIADAAAETKTTLVAWVRALMDDRPQVHAPADNVQALTKLLGQQVRAISTLEWAGEFVAQMCKLELRLRGIVEANKGRWYAGVCGTVTDEETGAFCTRVLYADPTEQTVRCPVCRTTWPVVERRKILLEQACDQVTNIATIARACLALLGEETSQARLERRIQNWVDRGLIERQGHLDVDGRVRKVYRLGDVYDLLTGVSRDESA